MKKIKFILLTLVIVLAFGLSSCMGDNSMDVGKHGIVSLPNGKVVEGEIEALSRWSASTCDITIDGVTYSVHPLCVAVVGESEDTE